MDSIMNNNTNNTNSIHQHHHSSSSTSTTASSGNPFEDEPTTYTTGIGNPFEAAARAEAQAATVAARAVGTAATAGAVHPSAMWDDLHADDDDSENESDDDLQRSRSFGGRSARGHGVAPIGHPLVAAAAPTVMLQQQQQQQQQQLPPPPHPRTPAIVVGEVEDDDNDDSMFWATEDETLHNLGESFTLRSESEAAAAGDVDDPFGLLLPVAPVVTSSSLLTNTTSHRQPFYDHVPQNHHHPTIHRNIAVVPDLLSSDIPHPPTASADDSTSNSLLDLPLMGSGDYKTPTNAPLTDPWKDDNFGDTQQQQQQQQQQPNTNNFDNISGMLRAQYRSDRSLTLAEALPNWDSQSQQQPVVITPTSYRHSSTKSKSSAAAFSMLGTPSTVLTQDDDPLSPPSPSSDNNATINYDNKDEDEPEGGNKRLTAVAANNNGRPNNTNNHADDERPVPEGRTYCLAAAAAIVVCVAVLVGVVVLFVVRKDDNPSDETTALVAPTTPREQELQFSQATWEAIRTNDTSPQARAYQWLLDDDPDFWGTRSNTTATTTTTITITGRSEKRKSVDTHDNLRAAHLRQRFALATLYYALGGDDWTDPSISDTVVGLDFLNHDTHECDWLLLNTTDSGSDRITMDACGSVVVSSVPGNSTKAPSAPNIFQHDDKDEPSKRLRRNLQDHHHQEQQQDAGFRSVQELRLPFLYLVGSIPPEIELLTELRTVDLSLNSVSGGLPHGAFASLGRLERISLAYNLLTGAIDPEIRQLGNLTSLDLSSNHLSSTVPVELGALTKLENLQLGQNKLTGVLLRNLKGWGPTLTSLGLQHNQFTGIVPEAVSFLTSLRVLDLQHNSLVGSLPSALAVLTELQELWLSNNTGMDGPIPLEISSMENLRVIGLSHVGLTGTIPPELGALSKLSQIWLDGNDLTGPIPIPLELLMEESGGILSHAMLNKNRLTGVVPSGLCSLSNLEFDCGADLCGCDCDCIFQNTTSISANTTLDETDVSGTDFAINDNEPVVDVQSNITATPAEPDDDVEDPSGGSAQVERPASAEAEESSAIPVDADEDTWDGTIVADNSTEGAFVVDNGVVVNGTNATLSSLLGSGL